MTARAEPHTQAVIDRLTDQLPDPVVVYDAEVPTDPPQAYCVVYPDPGVRARSALAAISDELSMLVQVTCVGTTRRQAQDVADRAAGALVDHRLSVSGRQCWPITQEASVPVERDDQTRDPATDRPRFYAVLQVRVRSTAA
jgi:hypothetical protein